MCVNIFIVSIIYLCPVGPMIGKVFLFFADDLLLCVNNIMSS